jgi:hypothetical protein
LKISFEEYFSAKNLKNIYQKYFLAKIKIIANQNISPKNFEISISKI